MNRFNDLARLGCLILGLILLQPYVHAVEPVYPQFADSVYHFSAYYTATMSGTALSSTVQNPVGSSRRIFMEGITIESSAACGFNISMYGTAATATLISVTPLNNNITATVKAYGPSNAGAGTTITGVTLPAGGSRTIELPGVVLGSGNGSTNNITVTPTCTTGTVGYTWKMAQQRI